jgi:hypothetical protein
MQSRSPCGVVQRMTTQLGPRRPVRKSVRSARPPVRPRRVPANADACSWPPAPRVPRSRGQNDRWRAVRRLPTRRALCVTSPRGCPFSGPIVGKGHAPPHEEPLRRTQSAAVPRGDTRRMAGVPRSAELEVRSGRFAKLALSPPAQGCRTRCLPDRSERSMTAPPGRRRHGSRRGQRGGPQRRPGRRAGSRGAGGS